MPETRLLPNAPTRSQWIEAGGAITAHRHDDHQIVYAARGVLAVTTAAGTWVAPANRAVWIPAGTEHAHQAHGGLELHLVGLDAADNPLGLDEPAVLTVDPLLRELILAYTRASDHGDPARDDGDPASDHGDPASDHGDPARDDGDPARARLRAVLLDRLSASPQQPVHLPSPTAPLLVALCAILRADPGERRTLAALGREVGASERTLSRLFRADLGMTFPQWRTQLRLYRALVLLAEGLPVTAVAHTCGWASAGAFIDVFRRAYGHTPGTHRTR
ncbi:AraC family transcriptional regulator [Streptomyces halstedii]|uniref:AraC family transcriptional regulator n=1 Tax=Streptomyces halstedii TaxID=1944 RepID=UPI003693384F